MFLNLVLSSIKVAFKSIMSVDNQLAARFRRFHKGTLAFAATKPYLILAVVCTAMFLDRPYTISSLHNTEMF